MLDSNLSLEEILKHFNIPPKKRAKLLEVLKLKYENVVVNTKEHCQTVVRRTDAKVPVMAILEEDTTMLQVINASDTLILSRVSGVSRISVDIPGLEGQEYSVDCYESNNTIVVRFKEIPSLNRINVRIKNHEKARFLNN